MVVLYKPLFIGRGRLTWNSVEQGRGWLRGECEAKGIHRLMWTGGHLTLKMCSEALSLHVESETGWMVFLGINGFYIDRHMGSLEQTST